MGQFHISVKLSYCSSIFKTLMSNVLLNWNFNQVNTLINVLSAQNGTAVVFWYTDNISAFWCSTTSKYCTIKISLIIWCIRNSNAAIQEYPTEQIAMK